MILEVVIYDENLFVSLHVCLQVKPHYDHSHSYDSVIGYKHVPVYFYSKKVFNQGANLSWVFDQITQSVRQTMYGVMTIMSSYLTLVFFCYFGCGWYWSWVMVMIWLTYYFSIYRRYLWVTCTCIGCPVKIGDKIWGVVWC